MQLGWIDFSKEDRQKAFDVINLLSEQGAVDELGIGVIRDAFANYFFPGTSTIQTRAKYCDFNNLVYMARVRYNVMLSEDENTYANDEWSRLLPDIRHNATVDLDAVFGELQLINPRAKSFLSGIQTAFMASDIDMADELIRKRERSLKGAARAKLSRTKEFDHSKWVGGGMLDYRFSNARRIVNDIYAGEVNADV